MTLRSLHIAVLLLFGLFMAGVGAAQPGDAGSAPEGKQQPPAMLIADRMFVTADRRLVAEGHVEAFQDDIRMQATRVTFDRASGQLTIEGPIRIDQGGSVTVLADAAEMDESLQNGLLTGARMVFDRHVQLAALQMSRVSGRYTQLFKTAVTSCKVCSDGKPPLWQIRARKVTHDQQEHQLYFEGAQLRVLDVPVFYFPALRLPDPTLERATGFLIPSVRSTSQLGIGIKVPYFFRLGDSKDLTLTPYLSAKTKTLNYRYRQAFRDGKIEIRGAHTRDDLYPGEDRGYFFAAGEFSLRNEFKLAFDIKTTSDDAYLVDYGLQNYDRLQSEVSLSRITRDNAFRAALIHFKTLRDAENQRTIPSRILDISQENRFHPGGLGGEIRTGLYLHGFQRTSGTNVTGRDVARGTVDVGWTRRWTTAFGLLTDWSAGVAADGYEIRDDSTYPDQASVVTPRATLTLRYPMTRKTASGGTDFLEPILQVGWTNATGDTVPNDESGFVEFDQGNLLSMSRFPAVDRREDGLTLVYGLNWLRSAPNGWQAAATIGQVMRKTADPDFTKTSGLSGTSSDLLLAGQLRMNKGLDLTARGVFSNKLNFDKAEIRGAWNSNSLNLSATYLWLGVDAAESRTSPVSEFWFDGNYEFAPNWTAAANLRYELADNRATSAGFGLTWENECVTVDLSVNRRYTSSTSVEPSTDFGFTIALSGFAVKGGTENYRRTCSRNS